MGSFDLTAGEPARRTYQTAVRGASAISTDYSLMALGSSRDNDPLFSETMIDKAVSDAFAQIFKVHV